MRFYAKQACTDFKVKGIKPAKGAHQDVVANTMATKLIAKVKKYFVKQRQEYKEAHGKEPPVPTIASDDVQQDEQAEL